MPFTSVTTLRPAPGPSRRTAQLHDFDGYAADFRADGGTVRDIDRLAALANRIHDDMQRWAAMVRDLDAPVRNQLDGVAAGEMVVEAVFGNVLEPSACRVLTAALKLAAVA